MNHPAPSVADLHAQRHRLREEWLVDQSTWIVALIADWPQAADAVRGITAVGLAAETGRPLCMLVHPLARGVGRAVNIARAMGRANRVIVDDRAAPPWPCLAACDAAVVVDEAATGSRAIFEAAGLAVLGSADAPARLISRQLVLAYDARLTQPSTRPILGDLSR